MGASPSRERGQSHEAADGGRRRLIDPQRADTAEHTFSRQSKHDGNRPVNALGHGQLRRVTTELRAEFLHNILCDPLLSGKCRYVQRLRHSNVDVQSTFDGQLQAWKMGYHGFFPRVVSSGSKVVIPHCLTGHPSGAKPLPLYPPAGKCALRACEMPGFRGALLSVGSGRSDTCIEASRLLIRSHRAGARACPSWFAGISCSPGSPGS